MLLTLDLKGHVPEDSRQKVYAKLAELLWTKIPNVDTAWRCSFKESVAESGAIFTAQSDVAKAAAAGSVKQYYAVVLPGENQPTEFHS